MASLDLIAEISVSRDLQPLIQTNYQDSMFITDEQIFSERSRQYSRSSDMITDGFTADSPTYKAVRTYFSQTPKPTQVSVGRRDATAFTVGMLPAQAIDNKTYTVTVGGTDYPFIAGTSTTVALILAGLEPLIDADDDVTVVLTGTGDATILTITEDNDTTIAISRSEFIVTWTVQESWAAALVAVRANNDLWYSLATYDHSIAGCLAIAVEINATSKLYFTSNSHEDNKEALSTSPSANNLIGQFEELNYDRATCIYSGDADNTFIEMGILGSKMPAQAGATNWDLAKASGVPSDNLTATEITNIRAQNGNYYADFNGIDFMRQGSVASGEWIDVMRGSDNLASDMQIAVVRTMARANLSGSKIALTDKGVGQLIAACEGVMQTYVKRNFIRENFLRTDAAGDVVSVKGYTITAGLVADLSSNTRATRTAPIIQIIAYLASAVNKSTVAINLFV